MAELPKLRKLIGTMYLEIITGDVHIRNQYLNILLTHVSVCLRMEKLEPRQPAVELFRTRLHNTISMILHNNHPLPAYDERRGTEIRKIQNFIGAYIIKIDEHVADLKGIEQIGIIEDIETLEYCRNVCYSASSDYSEAMSGKPDGLTQATNKYAMVINLVTPILYRYSMCDISDADWANAARLALKRTEVKA